MTSSLVGSEMCIRDRTNVALAVATAWQLVPRPAAVPCGGCALPALVYICLLYTSDAADDM
eukprot:2280102-Prorocentrum_lima.AAC.1